MQENIKKILLTSLVFLFLGAFFLNFSNEENITPFEYFSRLASATKSDPEVYSWNQKMTLTAEIDGNVYEGSSIIKVTWRENPRRINDAKWLPEIEGQAPSIVLGDGTRLYGLLGRGGYSLVPAWIAFEKDGSFVVSEEMLNEVYSAPAGTMFANEFEGYPHLVGFDEPNIDISVFWAEERFPIKSVKLVVEKTDGFPERETITNELPWLLKSRAQLVEDTGGVPKAANYSVDGGRTNEAVSKHDLLHSIN